MLTDGTQIGTQIFDDFERFLTIFVQILPFF